MYGAKGAKEGIKCLSIAQSLIQLIFIDLHIGQNSSLAAVLADASNVPIPAVDPDGFSDMQAMSDDISALDYLRMPKEVVEEYGCIYPLVL